MRSFREHIINNTGIGNISHRYYITYKIFMLMAIRTSENNVKGRVKMGTKTAIAKFRFAWKSFKISKVEK